MTHKKIELLPLMVSIGIAELAGGIGSIFTTPNISTWYAGLVKPMWNPPNWIFAPVWTTLFVCMGVASYRIWMHRRDAAARHALQVYALHLLVNIVWSVLFFGAKMLGVAFAEIILLWGMIVYLVIRFYKIDKTAGLLLVPYLLWVSFASALNYTVWMLNR